jgi:hypothetical protein
LVPLAVHPLQSAFPVNVMIWHAQAKPAKSMMPITTSNTLAFTIEFPFVELLIY